MTGMINWSIYPESRLDNGKMFELVIFPKFEEITAGKESDSHENDTKDKSVNLCRIRGVQRTNVRARFLSEI